MFNLPCTDLVAFVLHDDEKLFGKHSEVRRRLAMIRVTSISWLLLALGVMGITTSIPVFYRNAEAPCG